MDEKQPVISRNQVVVDAREARIESPKNVFRNGSKWIYLSPHLDDVVISCGGLIWEQVQAGALVEIWTICAGDPPAGPLSPFALELHARWEIDRQAVDIRRKEDQLACLEMGAIGRHFAIPDCIYRTGADDGQHLYTSDAGLFGDLAATDIQLVETVRSDLEQYISDGDNLIAPMAIGNHVDHQLTRAAAEALGYPLLYYADYPYAHLRQEQIKKLPSAGWKQEVFPISRDGMQVWAKAVMAHQSQISSFWEGVKELQADLDIYREQMGGVCLWRRPDLFSAP